MVKEEYRNTKIGSQLLVEIEETAKEYDCHIVHLDTFDFQAKDFYIKHGYEVHGVLDDCPQGHKRYYMKRGKYIMDIEIVKVAEEEREILARLIELYEYDFSEYENSDVSFLGLYGYTYLDYYWTEKRRFPYFIKVNNKLAGFAMVCDYCYVSEDEDTLFMSEFFVMKKYRRNGIGKYAAKKVLEMHSGKWELTVHPNNPISHIFWESVIKGMVGNDFKKHFDVEDVYDEELGIAYTFRNDL